MTPQPSDIELHQILLELSQASPRAAGLRPWGHHEGPTLDMSAWSYIRQYDPEDLVMTVGAGTRLSTVSETLARESQWLPLNVPDGGDDSIGGAVATQLDGWYRGGYGPFRDRVLGLRVVTPAFGPIFVGSRVVKNVAGFNLPRLFAGTRGSLGVITEVTLRVSPRPPVEALWVHPIAPGEYAHTLDALSATGATWASLSVVHSRNTWSLCALWHGRKEGLEPLAETLGMPTDAGMLPRVGDQPEAVLVAGAVPRAHLGTLIERWPSSASLQLECQTGAYFGELRTNDEYQSLKGWMEQISGSLRLLKDTQGTVPPASARDPLWDAIKRHYDPNGCLRDFWG